ncbi:O-fucosyltransferase 23-like [Lotus japonicus]|uniref:O-fucosyltransferase 23-like n=1 Tax=Lotus japonicus TaxID=34305 RepID=UPI00258496B6|nr:O-fucosyltransferase 23-like [Lotus japonicus]XP_057433616.1 O-fucosyltransferase 23-like [Lotus japonicus]
MEVLSKFLGGTLKSTASKCMVLFVTVLILRVLFPPSFPGFDGFEWSNFVYINSHSELGIRQDKFLAVPQLVWGLNNQKIAFARACLTARMLNRTLLMPSFSASLFYKEIDLLQPISFDKVFQFDKFNTLCRGFVRLGYYSDVLNRTEVLEMQKGSGRRWTLERDLSQLKEYSIGSFDDYEVIRIVGKNPFMWHDHWHVKDYARVFECLEVIDEIAQEADRVVSRIREVGKEVIGKTESEELKKSITSDSSSFQPLPYVSVHMRIEIDWMIHCKKLEQRLNTNQICSSKKEIMERVKNIVGLKTPIVVYLAVADKLLNTSSIMEGWGDGFLPFEKKKLAVDGIYKKYPYLIQSAIDYEVCLRADIFVGNSFSTFSSLIVLERTQKMIRTSVTSMCGTDVRWPSYAYNLAGESNGPMRWITNMSDSSLQAISYGTNHISSCKDHILI